MIGRLSATLPQKTLESLCNALQHCGLQHCGMVNSSTGCAVARHCCCRDAHKVLDCSADLGASLTGRSGLARTPFSRVVSPVEIVAVPGFLLRELHEAWLAVEWGAGGELAAGPGGEPHPTTGALSALPDHWPGNPCHAANHGCHHLAGRDVQGSYRFPDLSLSLLFPLFLPSRLSRVQQWATNKTSEQSNDKDSVAGRGFSFTPVASERNCRQLLEAYVSDASH
jgi:hypothetical protein